MLCDSCVVARFSVTCRLPVCVCTTCYHRRQNTVLIAMTAHHTWDDQPKGRHVQYRWRLRPSKAAPAGRREAITVILRGGCSRHARMNGGDDAAVKPAPLRPTVSGLPPRPSAERALPRPPPSRPATAPITRPAGERSRRRHVGRRSRCWPPPPPPRAAAVVGGVSASTRRPARRWASTAA